MSLSLQYLQFQPLMALLEVSAGVLEYLQSSGTLAYAPLMSPKSSCFKTPFLRKPRLTFHSKWVLVQSLLLKCFYAVTSQLCNCGDSFKAKYKATSVTTVSHTLQCDFCDADFWFW